MVCEHESYLFEARRLLNEMTIKKMSVNIHVIHEGLTCYWNQKREGMIIEGWIRVIKLLSLCFKANRNGNKKSVLVMIWRNEL